MALIKLIFSNRLLNICYVTIILGLACLLSSVLIGSEVDEKVFLREPFSLLTAGVSLILIGMFGIFCKFCLIILLKIFGKNK